MVQETDWDLNKENIKPIPEGRISSEIVSRDDVQAHSSNNQDEIESFEKSIEEINSPNILTNWFKYIYWTEQKNVSSGKKVYELLERCLKAFQMNSTYFNEEIYITIWIKYARLSEKQLDIYHFMFNNNIGSEHIKFYKAWAYAMEINGLYSKAIEIFKLGVNRNLKDGDKLLIYLNALNERIKSSKININSSTTNSNDSLLFSITNNDYSTSNNNNEQQQNRRRKAFNSLVECNKYEESMDRINHTDRAKPYNNIKTKNSQTQAELTKQKPLHATDVYTDTPREQMNEILNDELSASQQPLIKESLKESWSKPYIVSDVDADNVAPTTKISKDMILPKPSLEKYHIPPLPTHVNNSFNRDKKPVSMLCNNNLSDGVSIKNPSNTVSVTEIYLEQPSLICVVNGHGGESNISCSGMSTLINDSTTRKFRYYGFKYSKMNDEVKGVMENPLKKDQPNRPKIFYIISPEMDYVGQEKEYSFEELLAAKYKKYKRSNR